MAITYIDPSAGVNGSGTFASPKNTWAGLTLSGNNSFLQKQGTTFVGQIGTTAGNGGGVGSELKFGTYESATGAQILDGSNPASINGNAANGEILWIDNHNDIIVTGLIGYNTSSSAHGPWYCGGGSSQRVQFLYCIAHDYRGADSAGFYIRGANSKALYCQAYNGGGEGFFVEGDNVEVGYCTVHDISQDGATGDCIQVADSASNTTNNPYIHHNTLDHSLVDSKQVIIINQTRTPGDSTGGRVEFNSITGPNGGSACWGLHVGWPGIRAIGNRLINCPRAIDVGTDGDDLVAICNIITAESGVANTRGFNFFGGGARALLFGNVIANLSGSVANSTVAIGNSSGADHLYKNNILSGWKTAILVSSGGTTAEDYNCLNDNQTDRSGISAGLNSIGGDPLFVGGGDYHLQAGSPCIGSGVDPGVTITTFDDLTMAAPFDIGAYWSQQVRKAWLRAH